MGARAAAFVAALWVGMPAAALACGVCIEDKVAVTYDHAVIERAAKRHHAVVFVALDGLGDAHVLARDARNAATRVHGIDADSVRSAADPPALSFAFDPAAQSAENALREVERHAHVPGLKLTLLRLLR